MNIYNLLQDLFQYSKESEWFEYKMNWFQPVALGEYVSALSNSATLVGDKVGNKTSVSRKNGLNDTRKTILSEMRHNPNITKKELAVLIGISETAIDNNIKYLKQNGYIERIGPNKDGWWKVLK